MIKNINGFYNKLKTNTRLIIRISMITFFCAIFGAMYSHTAIHMENYYALLILSEDLLSVAKSTIGVGFISTLVAGSLER
jgi:hypothetical protein